MVKMRSEPDGKRVSHNKVYKLYIVMAMYRMTQMVKMDLLENHVCYITAHALLLYQKLSYVSYRHSHRVWRGIIGCLHTCQG